MLLSFLRQVVPNNGRNCHLTMPAIKECYACDVRPDTCNIGQFKSGKKNSATMKHIYNESANIIEGRNVAFDTNDWWNFS